MFSYPAHIGDWQTRVIQAGKVGQAIVLVHGTGGRADRWTRNLDALADAGYRAYAFDLPGHGFARKGPGFDYSVPGYAAFLGAFLDAMDIHMAVLVGTSLGGHVVASYACRHPARVRALVLSGSMGLLPLGAEARGRVQRGANNQSYDGVKERLHRVIFDPALITEDFVDEEHGINNSPGAKESFAHLGEYIGTRLDDDVAGERLAKMRAPLPTLLVWGREDKTVPLAAGEAAHKLLPGSRLQVFDRAAHSPYFERPADFNRAVVEFLSALPVEHAAERVEAR